MFDRENSSLVREYAGEKLIIEPWGKDSLRVRSTMRPAFDDEDWALLPRERAEEPEISIRGDGFASITHGRITARVDPRGQIAFLNQKGEILLEEFMRVRLGNMEKGNGQIDQAAVTYFNSALSIYPREFKPTLGGDYALTVRFESRPEERLFGMGQYQRARDVYLPTGTRWISHGSGEIFDGGQVVNESAPLAHLPVFFREKGSVFSK